MLCWFNSSFRAPLHPPSSLRHRQTLLGGGDLRMAGGGLVVQAKWSSHTTLLEHCQDFTEHIGGMYRKKRGNNANALGAEPIETLSRLGRASEYTHVPNNYTSDLPVAPFLPSRTTRCHCIAKPKFPAFVVNRQEAFVVLTGVCVKTAIRFPRTTSQPTLESVPMRFHRSESVCGRRGKKYLRKAAKMQTPV